MSFRIDWRIPAIWLFISCTKIWSEAIRLSRHGMHDHWAVFQLVLWSIAAVLLICRFFFRWVVTADSLILKRFPFPQLVIPCNAISSVDWGKYNQGGAVVRYAKGSKPRKAIVMVSDMPGLLDELEQCVPADVMHV